MPSLLEQLELGANSISRADLDSLTRLIQDPDSVSLDDHRTVAERLGLHGGFLAAAVNVFADPKIWIAALYSRVFPTAAFVTGRIPKHFVGYANEFTGISALWRPITSMFNGTNIPRMEALYLERMQAVTKIGNRMFDKTRTRPNWANEKEVVSHLMEGQPHPMATAELRSLAGSLREDMNHLYKFLSQAHRVTGGFDEGEAIVAASSRPYTKAEAPRYLRDYLPHIPITHTDSIFEPGGREALARMTRNSEIAALAKAGADPNKVWTARQSNQLHSDFNRYQQFLEAGGARFFSPHLLRRTRNIPLTSQMGGQYFVTDLDIILQKYVHSVARTYALNAPLFNTERLKITVPGIKSPTNEPLMVQIMNEGLAHSGAKFERFQVAGQFNRDGTPVLRERLVDKGSIWRMMGLKILSRNLKGMSSMDEVLFGDGFGTMFNKAHDKIRGLVGRGQEEQLAHALDNLRAKGTYRSVANGLTSYFYANIAGLNPWFALQNTLQPIIGTIPGLGIGSTMLGARDLGARMPAFVRATQRHLKASLGTQTDLARIPVAGRPVDAMRKMRESLAKAYEDVFPEVARQGLRVDPRLYDVNENILLSRGARTYDELVKFSLAPFTTTESVNQLLTFFASKRALRRAIKTGEYELPKDLPESAIDDYLNMEAGITVNNLQFRPSPGSKTILQNYLPAPFRMFSTFPIRLLNSFAESTVRGAMTQEQLSNASALRAVMSPLSSTRQDWQKLLSLGTGRNLGTLARTYMYSQVAINGAREVLGVDVGESLGLLVPFESIADGRAFFGLAPIPPIASTAVDIVKATTTRDIRRLQPMYLPGYGPIPIPKTLFPGGVATARAIRAFQQYKPDTGGFVDADERLMYYGNDTDLILGMMGIPLDKNRRLREHLDIVASNRRSIRQYRREFAMARLNYDTAKMQKVAAAFGKAYPDMPPLTLSDQDMRRYRESAQVPAITRMLRTMGETGRFLEYDIYEVDPALVSPPALGGL